jgi:hypothetical protein
MSMQALIRADKKDSAGQEQSVDLDDQTARAVNAKHRRQRIKASLHISPSLIEINKKPPFREPLSHENEFKTIFFANQFVHF